MAEAKATLLGRIEPVIPERSDALTRATAAAAAAATADGAGAPSQRHTLIAIIGASHGGLACACSLLAAGVDPSSIAVFERGPEQREGGAGVVTDDLSVAFLKGLQQQSQRQGGGGPAATLQCESLPLESGGRVHPMRTMEERVGRSGHRLSRDEGFPCFSAYWADVRSLLRDALPEGLVRYNTELVAHTQLALAEIAGGSGSSTGEGCDGGIGGRASDSGVLLRFAGGAELRCDLLIAADGPTSGVRDRTEPSPAGWRGGLRYAGYYAVRGVLPVRTFCTPSTPPPLEGRGVATCGWPCVRRALSAAEHTLPAQCGADTPQISETMLAAG